MNIRLNPNRGQMGGWFLIIFIVILIMCIGGCTVYYIRKWSRKFEQPVNPTPTTNELGDVTIPLGTNPPFFSATLTSHWVVEMTNEEPSSFIDSFNFGGKKYSAFEKGMIDSPTNPPARVILVSFTMTNPVLPYLAVTNDIGWTNVDMSQYIQPGSAYLNLPRPTNEGRAVTLYSSSNLTDWTPIVTLKAETNFPAFYRDTTTQSVIFYRIIIP